MDKKFKKCILKHKCTICTPAGEGRLLESSTLLCHFKASNEESLYGGLCIAPENFIEDINTLGQKLHKKEDSSGRPGTEKESSSEDSSETENNVFVDTPASGSDTPAPATDTSALEPDTPKTGSCTWVNVPAEFSPRMCIPECRNLTILHNVHHVQISTENTFSWRY
ncbi:hypothetical protein QE152_g36847 [Popillia japonica]|uniref:Uncharacterized protein n=1 Tax=Popillia japonica TaxID=7064 RepID=A0AAW1ICG2_POPJA